MIRDLGKAFNVLFSGTPSMVFCFRVLCLPVESETPGIFFWELLRWILNLQMCPAKFRGQCSTSERAYCPQKQVGALGAFLYHGGHNDYQPVFFLFSPKIPAKNNRNPAKDPRIRVKRPYYAARNQFERFRFFLELFSRFEFEFCCCENIF